MDSSVSHSVLMGIVAGALTSTPGMAAAMEINGVDASDVALGYSSAYVFGVTAIVLFVQILVAHEHKKEVSVPNCEMSNGIFSFLVMSVVVGSSIGAIRTSSGVSIGMAGGVLLAGIFLGFMASRIGKISVSSKLELDNYRGLGLLLFFVGTGFSSGEQCVKGFKLKFFVYGMIITTASIIGGFVLTKLIRKSNTESATLIAGGMTSTPAISALINNRVHGDLSVYSLTYMSAMVSLIVLIKIIGIVWG